MEQAPLCFSSQRFEIAISVNCKQRRCLSLRRQVALGHGPPVSHPLGAMSFDWHLQQPGNSRSGSGDLSRLVVSTGRSPSSLRLSRELSQTWHDGDSICSGGSPHRGAGRGHR